eukprot:12626993-Ditylum_brightwellii.AAC.1
MKYPQEAIGTISASNQATSKNKSIISVWFKAIPTMMKVLLNQRNLVGLQVAGHNSKKYISAYLPILETMLDDDGDVVEEFVTRTTSVNVRKLHPVKTEACQVLNNFNEFGNVHTDMANKIPKGQELDRSKINSSLDLPEDGIDNTTLHIA